MGSKKTGATIATIVVAALAIIATLFLLYKMSQDRAESSAVTYVPDEVLSQEMNENAARLVTDNCTVFRLYLTKGLPHVKEPYNNVPEDGYYTVSSDEYKTLEDITKLVEATYVDSEAQRIISDVNKNGAVYVTREDGSLGISGKCIDETGKFISIDYDKSWSNPKVTIKPVSNTECKLTIELAPLSENQASAAAQTTAVTTGDTTSEATSVSSSLADTTLVSESSLQENVSADYTLNAVMKKVNGKWVLEKLVY